MTEPSHAVFLSYASQDAQPAYKICAALRGAGIEVFLDQSELRGGDAWDKKIRREIHDCALFLAVISANTASRHDGYFRLEWDLADQRTHMIARSRAFIVPVCLDLTTQAAADVPESFNRVQWTRLPAGEAPPAFVERIKHLLSPESSSMSAQTGAADVLRNPNRAQRWLKPAPLVTMAVLVVALGCLVAYRLVLSKRGTEGSAALSAESAPPAVAAFNPPAHSIGVLPFTNMSGNKEQNPAAFDAYLRAEKVSRSFRDTKDLSGAILAYTEAIRLDPQYAIAFAARSLTFTISQGKPRPQLQVMKPMTRRRRMRAKRSHSRLTSPRLISLWRPSWMKPSTSCRRMTSTSGRWRSRREMPRFCDRAAHSLPGWVGSIPELRPRAAPSCSIRSLGSHYALGKVLYSEHRFAEALAAFAELITLDPDFKESYGNRGLSFYGLGDLERARVSCETQPDSWLIQQCLAVV